MIVFDLKCSREHRFEAWFRSGGAYERQRGAGKIACPECGSASVTKAPMAPRLARRREKAPAPAQAAPEASAAMIGRETLDKLRKDIEARCENVGERFPEEARKIHYGETERRDIYGRATDDEAAALAEEGVEFHRLPWPRREDA